MSQESMIQEKIALMDVYSLQRGLVYDHKMLWRANLYIDENDDWNDEHRWDSADNEWNKVYSFQQNGFNLGNLVDGTGEQDMTPHSFSWSCGNATINNTVSYDYNGQDSPFVFNNKMDQQKKWLGLYFNSQNQRFENPLVNDTQDNSYSSTIAPSETYKNYIFVNEYPYSNPSAKAGHRQGQDNPWAPDDDNLTNSQVPRTIDDISCYPYLPGFNCSQHVYTDSEDDDNIVDSIDWNSLVDLSNHAGKGAGTDCLSFIQRSASYTGNNYTWTVNFPLGENEGNIWWDDERHSNIRFPSTANNYSYEIESRPVINQELPDLKRVVPGDIVFYTGHIMIVNKIDIDGDRSDIQMEDIHLIEATFGSTWGKVCNHRTLQERHTNDKDWVIWRLRNNE
jgi:hypothetical protein